MHKHWKIYLTAVAVALLCIGFPWLLARLGVLTNYAVLNDFAIPTAIIAMAASITIILYCVPNAKTKFTFLILNPAPYYMLFLMWFWLIFSA